MSSEHVVFKIDYITQINDTSWLIGVEDEVAKAIDDLKRKDLRAGNIIIFLEVEPDFKVNFWDHFEKSGIYRKIVEGSTNQIIKKVNEE